MVKCDDEDLSYLVIALCLLLAPKAVFMRQDTVASSTSSGVAVLHSDSIHLGSNLVAMVTNGPPYNYAMPATMFQGVISPKVASRLVMTCSGTSDAPMEPSRSEVFRVMDNLFGKRKTHFINGLYDIQPQRDKVVDQPSLSPVLARVHVDEYNGVNPAHSLDPDSHGYITNDVDTIAKRLTNVSEMPSDVMT